MEKIAVSPSSAGPLVKLPAAALLEIKHGRELGQHELPSVASSGDIPEDVLSVLFGDKLNK